VIISLSRDNKLSGPDTLRKPLSLTDPTASSSNIKFSNMSLARAFTLRGKKSEANISPISMGRAASHRNGKPVNRAQISSPVALVSTTNMLSYSAPSIASAQSANYRDFSASTASSTSGEDSDASTNSIHSNDTNTDMSSVDESPICAAPNHLSSYFQPAVDTTNNSPIHSPSMSTSATFEAPILPQRAASHSKHAHESLSRKRSVQRMQSPPTSARASSEFTPSLGASIEAPRDNPFGKELEQLDEIAEEFGQTVRNAEYDADTAYMRSHNLGVYAASDYLNEIHGMIAETFHEQREASAWF
jgi:hypothetical protein